MKEYFTALVRHCDVTEIYINYGVTMLDFQRGGTYEVLTAKLYIAIVLPSQTIHLGPQHARTAFDAVKSDYIV